MKQGCLGIFPRRFAQPAPGSFTAQEDGLMSRIVNRASAMAVAATLVVILFSAAGSGASAQATAEAKNPIPAAAAETGAPAMVSSPVVQPVATDQAADADDSPDSLAELVADQPQPEELSKQLNCLAGAIYFESKGETLAGQLAVGRVIVARSESGRFPDSYCGVVYQHAQFSFVRGGSMPAINRDSPSWRNAVAIAQIADEGSWDSKAEGALFFHARYVSPHWHRTRVAAIDNHIFYR